MRWLEKYADYELAPLCTFAVFRNRLLKPMLGQSCDEDAVQTALTAKLPKHFDYLEQTLGNGSTPSRTVFGLRKHLGCWWVRL